MRLAHIGNDGAECKDWEGGHFIHPNHPEWMNCPVGDIGISRTRKPLGG